MIDENEVKEKQEYLRINILDKGYDGGEFMNYLQTLKGENGLQIENWSKNDLIKAVQEFKRINPIKENNNKNPNQDNNEKNDQFQNNQNNNNFENINKNDINNNIINNNNNNYKNNNDNNDNNENNQNNQNNQIPGQEYIQCKKVESNQLPNKKNLIFTLSLPEVKEGGLFSKSYITYLVETKPLGLQVRRRFKDFIWLHDILKSLYINCIIPQIKKKNYIMGIDHSGIRKRMRTIEKFLKEISIHPLLGRTQIFYDFISIRDEKDFSIKKQNYDKLKPPTKTEEIKSLNGEINISINRDKELLADKIKEISETNEDLMKKITKEYKILNLHLQGVISKIKDINLIWNQLYNKSNNNFEGEIILGTYDSLSRFMEDWAASLQTKINLINIRLREYFRYIRNDYNSIKEYYNTYSNMKNNYKKSYKKLMETKERLFEEKKLDDWGLDREDLENKVLLFKEKELSMSKMLPEETKKVKDKKKMYGCYLNSLIEEYEIIKTLNSKRHKENIINFIKDMSNNIITHHVSLNEIVGYLDTIKEDLFIYTDNKN